MPCHVCQRVQTDPQKGASPWARGVIGVRQILICPQCQAKDPHWSASLTQCPKCGSTRLSVMLGSVVCRGCNSDWPAI